MDTIGLLIMVDYVQHVQMDAPLVYSQECAYHVCNLITYTLIIAYSAQLIV